MSNLRGGWVGKLQLEGMKHCWKEFRTSRQDNTHPRHNCWCDCQSGATSESKETDPCDQTHSKKERNGQSKMQPSSNCSERKNAALLFEFFLHRGVEGLLVALKGW